MAPVMKTSMTAGKLHASLLLTATFSSGYVSSRFRLWWFNAIKCALTSIFRKEIILNVLKDDGQCTIYTHTCMTRFVPVEISTGGFS